MTAMSKAVADVYTACPAPARAMALSIRDLILTTARNTPEIGPLTETLKWRQPSYAPKRAKIGTPVRIGWSDDAISLYVHCQTTLIEDWRAQYQDTLTFIGNREVRLPLGQALPADAVQHCIAMALTYHARKTAS